MIDNTTIKKTLKETHWQILIAVLLGAIVGVFLSQDYLKYHVLEVKPVQQYVTDSTFATKTVILSDTFAFKSNVQVVYGHKKGTAIAEPIMLKVPVSVYENEDMQKYLATHKIPYIKADFVDIRYVDYIEWMGRAFMHLIKLIIIPLVMMAIISGVSNLGLTGNLGKVGFRTILFYALTTTFAVLTGLILVNVIGPGHGLHFAGSHELGAKASSDMIPDNFIRALYEGNMMVIVFSALLFGFFITKIDEKNQERLSSVFSSFFDVMMKLTQFIIKLSPYGIFGLIVNLLFQQDDIGKMFTNIMWYALTVFLALAFHGLITLPAMLKFWGGVKPFRHMKNMSVPLLTAFTTCSSGAALPYTIDAVQNKSKVSKRITNFVIPLGGTMNFDGTALYECVAVIFIAQVGGMDLTFQNQLVIVLMSLMVSFAGAAVPMAGLFMIPVVLHTAFPNNPELSALGIALIFPVDRFLDMFRTTINVWSDCCAAALVAKKEGEVLDV